MSNQTILLRRDKTTLKGSFAAGRFIGQEWIGLTLPGGPRVPAEDSGGKHTHWNEYCRHKKACRTEWLRGFGEGLKSRGGTK